MINYINDVIITTIVVKMRTLIKDSYWNILKLFYNNRNTPLHLREISRKINLDQSALTRHLNNLTADKVLVFIKDGNLKKFYIKNSAIKNIFPIYDANRFEALPLVRRNAVKFYIEKLEEKPVFIMLFGSSAKGTFREDSDLDMLIVVNRKIDTKNSKRYAESQTGIVISEFLITYTEFIKELKLKEDKVIQSSIESGILVYNATYYYELIFNERV